MRIALSKAVTVIGGDDEAKLLILRRGPEYILVAEGAAGQARVNGQPVEAEGWRLGHRDAIQLRDAELIFFHPSAYPN